MLKGFCDQGMTCLEDCRFCGASDIEFEEDEDEEIYEIDYQEVPL